ncbi:GNAT family N-acetyltransferase [Paenibacillus hemerocallicola]|jgi:ribosomal protein S18 acetylase RimI-like enzyme|uniref:GNAT family N-acetyltransferase n=1 Tax=Paenibacillus hemerocallicola TaxID=1172614 RepID=A0A5C4TEX9_9BACL|nr:GNAT family N-acetyltransferase [Paenibacillus hemerocallicola]TNJ67694.1 GNAT family N-acetyltransferase [Paenibacillus hemerocallicola]
MNILYEVPDAKEYIALRIAAGMNAKDESVAKTALSHSIFSVIVRGEHSELIGMGRMIGDGACFFQIVDIAVSPSHRDQELDKVIIGEIMDYLNQNAPEGADVILLTDVPAIGLYQKYGFEFTYPKSISLCKTM